MRSANLTTGAALVLLAVLLSAHVSGQAAANERIRFQGRLLDSVGAAITVANSVDFNLYTTPTGGTAVWTETLTVTPSGTGVFSVELGGVTDFTGVDFSQPLYLGITVSTDAEMTPRFLFTSSSVAHYALDSDTLDGLDGTAFATLAAANNTFTGNISAVNVSASGTISGNGSGLTTLSSSALTGALPALDGSALTSISSSALTGALPALDGSALTSLSSSSLTGALPALDGSALTSLSSSALTGALPALDGSALTGLTAGQVSGTFPDSQVADNLTINGGVIDNTIIGGTTAAAGTFTTLTATSLGANLDLGGFNLSNGGTITGTFAGNLTGNVTGNLTGTASNASQLLSATWAAPAGIGSTTANSGAFTTLSASGLASFAAGVTVTGGNSLFTAPLANAPASAFSAHAFNSSVDNNGANPARGIFSRMDGTNGGTREVGGGWVEALSDGDITQGLFGQATYTGTGGTGFEQAIGLDGRARISTATEALTAIGTAGRADDTQNGSNIGVHAWAANATGANGRNVGLFATVNTTVAQQITFGGTLPADITASVIGHNQNSGTNDFGLHVTAANNVIDGDLTVTGNLTGTITGTASNADLLDSLDSTAFAQLAAGSNTFTGSVSAAGLSSSNGLTLSGGTLSLPAGSVTNAMLANNGLTVTAGTGLTGGGAVSLGGTVTLNNNGVLGLTGTAGRVSVGGTGQNPTVDIDSAYLGQTSITTLGTISAGTWQGTAVADGFVANDLTIVGGTIDNTPIGATTRSSGEFTSVLSTGVVSGGTVTSLGDFSAGGNLLVADDTNRTLFSQPLVPASGNAVGFVVNNLGAPAGTFETRQGVNVLSIVPNSATTAQSIGLRSRVLDEGGSFAGVRQTWGVSGVSIFDQNGGAGANTALHGAYFDANVLDTTDGILQAVGVAADAAINSGSGFTTTQNFIGGRFGVLDSVGATSNATGVVATVINNDATWAGTPANTRLGPSTGLFSLATGSLFANMGSFNAANATQTNVNSVLGGLPGGFSAGVYAYNPSGAVDQWALFANGNSSFTGSVTVGGSLTVSGSSTISAGRLEANPTNSPANVSNVPHWIRVPVPVFSTSGTSETVNLVQVPAGTVVQAVKLKHSASYSGGVNTSFTLDIGRTGTETELLAGADVFTATGDTVFYLNNVTASWDHANPTQLVVRANADSDVTTGGGAAEVWLLVSQAD